ncbi:hypothetical protein [Mesobacillus foraminis]|uniref:Uncharacterized protein n=1 Tax=Mesobacillus foraminis TaxID=279826 RepID=A0A4R2B012_9BACI|nr:hypothetical protein [Mesobacillus foraminis]TCN19757.1 hypothetical protein EV146_11662 [Mesobacillus foraminis]
MKRGKKAFLWAIGLLVLTGIIYSAYPKPIYSDITSSFKVSSKGSAGGYWVSGYDPEKLERESIKIKVADEKLWNELQEGETYFLTYIIKGEKVELQEVVKAQE